MSSLTARQIPRLIDLAACIALPLLTGFVGNIFVTAKLDNWYSALDKPFINPPNWVFNPLWIMLYISIGISFFLVYETISKVQKSKAYMSFSLLLVLSTAWTVVFFGMQAPWAGFVVMLGLLASLVWTIFEFYRITPIAGYIIIPGAVWVGYATLISFIIALIN